MMTKQSSDPADGSSSESWLDDACILDIDFFVKTLSGIKSKGVCADLIGSVITHYASKWLPEISSIEVAERSLTQFQESPESVAVSWMKKRFFVETLIGVLPPEKNSIPCNFLLRLLRTANMVGVEAAFRSELENKISQQLDEASLKELMIPSFNHTCGTLLDVDLVIRLVSGFVSLDREGVKSGAALVKVAKLVDLYLAEAAIDANLSLSEFVALAGALPSHARATDDSLYGAIDTYLKVHAGVTKHERKGLCSLIDSSKLTAEASLHAAQNERLPVRAVLQVLFSEQTKRNNRLHHHLESSEQAARCGSRREVMEIKKLKEEVVRLQSQCNAMQAQMERMTKKRKLGFFWWRKPAIIRGLKSMAEQTTEGGPNTQIAGGATQINQPVAAETNEPVPARLGKRKAMKPRSKVWEHFTRFVNEAGEVEGNHWNILLKKEMMMYKRLSLICKKLHWRQMLISSSCNIF